ncbi:MAG: thioredoxin family protein [Lentisphaerae bacterium]|nr:thioredoxin family protein [Lentisphaerota bacterium]
MNGLRLLLVWLAAAAASAAAAAGDPFAVHAALEPHGADTWHLTVALSVPAGHYVYAESLDVAVPPAYRLRPLAVPDPVPYDDPFQEARVAVYTHDTVFAYAVAARPGLPLPVTVRYQGCSPTLCYLPASREFSLEPAAAAQGSASEPDAPSVPATELRLAARESGYLPPGAFLDFLDRVEAGAAGPARLGGNLWLTVGLILLGGLALNLTPCVLPMIPVNIAVIGAGAAAGSRRRGAALGAAYGAGIAAVYGALGLLVVLTGATFGAVNASPWFNLAIGILFLLLSLSMFGAFHIDFSRFQARVGTGAAQRKGSLAAALALGGVAALLAGACVAPVVISVLVLAADLYARGRAGGLVLPFLLGLGMALPWPFAGAGLSFLPRPGQWMRRINLVFGVIILGFGVWYLVLGARLLHGRLDAAPVPDTAAEEASGNGWLTSLPDALERAAREGKPVFIDFWATWCKSCLQMDKTTFRDAEVQRRLKRYVTVKVQAEDPSDPATRAVLDRYGVLGLPTYVILKPRD